MPKQNKQELPMKKSPAVICTDFMKANTYIRKLSYFLILFLFSNISKIQCNHHSSSTIIFNFLLKVLDRRKLHFPETVFLSIKGSEVHQNLIPILFNHRFVQPDKINLNKS